MYYNSLQRTSPHCNTLEHTATHCNTLHHRATNHIALQHTAAHIATQCRTLQHTATHCNALQCTAAYCNTLQYTGYLLRNHTSKQYVHILMQHAVSRCKSHGRGSPVISREDVGWIFFSSLGTLIYIILNNVRRCRRSVALEAVMPKVD